MVVPWHQIWEILFTLSQQKATLVVRLCKGLPERIYPIQSAFQYGHRFFFKLHTIIAFPMEKLIYPTRFPYSRRKRIWIFSNFVSHVHRISNYSTYVIRFHWCKLMSINWQHRGIILSINRLVFYLISDNGQDIDVSQLINKNYVS